MTRPPGGTTAVVPLRDGVSGKSRLAAVLDAAARRRLVQVLARHVATTLRASAGVERVVVVTADPAFARATLDGLGVEVLEQPTDRPGLNGALEHAREVAGPGRLLVAHADLPALAPADVAAVLAQDAPVTIAADRYRSGTNLLALRPSARAFRFRFGAGSLAAHLVEAAAHGLEAAVVHRPGTAVDLDTADDWAQLPGAVRAAVSRDVPGLM
ncbi:2-phospho-L-lactate guanylyltransferase [Promicromonospora citrea]|uniref:Phosphoenolpyruvate guanylyltransferase n=1 Tax=Promicromonospora citrea TaxID=43677 RepID=A0A8H9GFV2_9MICO|nr:2-phospho-L-lactate guanylyltransferase [Promicromonospora citrea]NNH54939.1 2-phospho-L-lactate guanylyltransferase [Promicromonospora citrea]GGM19523.1 hypothetical protein GCM10010102_13840 [Promicromonospora citrea]